MRRSKSRVGVFRRWVPVLLMLGFSQVAATGQVVRVPEDAGDLDQAVRLVADGGIIDIASGTYPVPDGGYRVARGGKSFTVRARAPGSVVFDGGGTSPILRLDGAGGKEVIFEGLSFDNGFSQQETVAGGVSINGRMATFRDCHFRNNRTAAPTTGGGGLRVAGGARVVLERVEVLENVSSARGGGVSVIQSELVVRASTFRGNRVNLPGHRRNAVGGAIYLLDGTLLLERSLLESNHGAWVGGAVYAFGTWDRPGPQTSVAVVGSVFRDNSVRRDPCCVVPGVTHGGAIFVENRTRLSILGSRFEGNHGNWGGAVASFRAEIRVADSWFEGNYARQDDEFVAAGGTFILLSSDAPSDGATNRRSSSLEMVGGVIRGRPGGASTGTQGGCVTALGDRNRQFGLGGVARQGSLEANRAHVSLQRVILEDCRASASGSGGRTFGGAIYMQLGDLSLEDSLVLEGAAVDGVGGALAMSDASRAEISRTTFDGNSAEELGGAINATGSELFVQDSHFLRNSVGNGFSGPVFTQGGSVLFVQPSARRGTDATGDISGSLFADNLGLPIFEGDAETPPFNRMTYNGNTFKTRSSQDKVLLNPLDGFDGASVSDLNGMILRRSGGVVTDKASLANARRSTAPASGRLVGALSRLDGWMVEGNQKAALGYSWVGGSAQLAGQALAETAGVRLLSNPGNKVLRVDGQRQSAVVVTEGGGGGACLGDLCLSSERFLVEVEWRDFTNRAGGGEVVPLRSNDSGLQWFFDPDNWEMLVKVLDACGVNNHFWVFSAATTNVEYRLRVTDLGRGVVRDYLNPLGRSAPALTDTGAFECVGSGESQRAASATASGPTSATVISTAAGSLCTPSATRMCLNGGRFQVEVEWRDFQGGQGVGEVVEGGSADSGLFYFFDESNWEMLVKVLDGCGVSDHFWVFAAATTNVAYTLRVTDTVTGKAAVYGNPLGQAADAVTDTAALAVCQ